MSFNFILIYLKFLKDCVSLFYFPKCVVKEQILKFIFVVPLESHLELQRWPCSLLVLFCLYFVANLSKSRDSQQSTWSVWIIKFSESAHRQKDLKTCKISGDNPIIVTLYILENGRYWNECAIRCFLWYIFVSCRVRKIFIFDDFSSLTNWNNTMKIKLFLDVCVKARITIRPDESMLVHESLRHCIDI